MKNFVLAIVAFSFFMSSCSKEDSDIEPEICPEFYEGEDCSTRQTAKFEGTYNGRFDDPTITYNEFDNIIITQDPEKVTGLYILLLDNITEAELETSNTFLIPEQAFYSQGSSIEGNGVLTNNSISISLKVVEPQQGTFTTTNYDFSYIGVK